MPVSTADSDTVNGDGPATRRRLLNAALEAFGEHGFDGVSTRQLASFARVNQAAILYHFGGKKGLYLAVVEDLVEAAQKTAGSAADEIRAQLEDRALSPEEATRLLVKLIRSMLAFLISNDQSPHRASFVMRELMHPSDAFERLYQGYLFKVHSTVTRLVAFLLDEEPEAPESILRAHALIGQLIGFGAGREVIQQRMSWESIGPARHDQIVRTVTETLLASIRGLRADRGMDPDRIPKITP